MKVLVTGSTGFLGSRVVQAGLVAGWQVVALVRPSTDLATAPWDTERVQVIRGDLRQPGPWRDQIAAAGVDVVVHLAAATSGDIGDQVVNTLVSTENLLSALDHDRLRRFVHISTFSVYDYSSPPTGSLLDEESRIEPLPTRRDAYTQTKRAQEAAVRQTLGPDVELVVLRPGAVYGPDAAWDHGAAVALGPFALIFSPRAEMRLCHVDNCAGAIVAAVTSTEAAGNVINLVDDEQPTHAEFFARCRDLGLTSRTAVPVPWIAVDTVGRALSLLDRTRLGGTIRLPELLAHRRQQARWRPMRYTNQRAKTLLGWTPTLSVDDGISTLRGPQDDP